MRKIIASLDIGSSNIKLVVGEIFKQKLNVLTSVDLPARGIKESFIVNPESAIESLKEVFEKAKNIIGLDIKKVIVTVPSHGAEAFFTNGSTTITSEDKVVKNVDIIRALQAAVYNKVSNQYELVSVMPTMFVLNDVDKVAMPVGSIAEKLTVKAVAITVPKKNVLPITKCLEKLNIEVIDTIIGPIGDYYEFKNSNNSVETGAVVNIGSTKTEVSIFKKGILTASKTIPIGGNNLDYELYKYYKVSRKDAEYLKNNLALAHKSSAQVNETVSLKTKAGDVVKVNQVEATEIINEKLVEMLNLIKKQINLLTKTEISYIMVTGGLTELKDFNILLDEMFNRKAVVGVVEEIGIRNNRYSSSAGLIKYYISRLKLRGVDFSIFNIDEEEELSGINKINISDNSVLGKLFGYFFDS